MLQENTPDEFGMKRMKHNKYYLFTCHILDIVVQESLLFVGFQPTWVNVYNYKYTDGYIIYSQNYRAAGAFTKPGRRQPDLSPGFVIWSIYIYTYMTPKPKDGGLWAQIKKYITYDSPKILKTYPGGYELSKKYRVYYERIFKIYETIVRRCGHFQNFEISDPKSQNFQNVENLKNHVFDVFRWIWQVFFISRFFSDHFLQMFFIDTTLSPQPCLRRPSSIELSLVYIY